MKKKEMSFNLHPLFYAENKGSFQFKWSIQEKGRVREKQRGRGRVNEAVSLVQEPFHHSLCCETVPLLGLSDANCSGESILLSSVYWLPLWEDLRHTQNGQFCIMLTSFLLEKFSKLLGSILKSNPQEKQPLSAFWTWMFLLMWFNASGLSWS